MFNAALWSAFMFVFGQRVHAKRAWLDRLAFSVHPHALQRCDVYAAGTSPSGRHGVPPFRTTRICG